MDAATIAHALDMRRNGKGWRGPCPVCGGSVKSTKFSLSDGRNGSPLVKCFAGCTFTDIVRELRDRGLWPDATHEQRERWRNHCDKQEADEGKTWLLVAESAVERGEKLSKRERQRFALLARLYGGQNEQG